MLTIEHNMKRFLSNNDWKTLSIVKSYDEDDVDIAKLSINSYDKKYVFFLIAKSEKTKCEYILAISDNVEEIKIYMDLHFTPESIHGATIIPTIEEIY